MMRSGRSRAARSVAVWAALFAMLLMVAAPVVSQLQAHHEVRQGDGHGHGHGDHHDHLAACDYCFLFSSSPAVAQSGTATHGPAQQKAGAVELPVQAPALPALTYLPHHPRAPPVPVAVPLI